MSDECFAKIRCDEGFIAPWVGRSFQTVLDYVSRNGVETGPDAADSSRSEAVSG